jgi:hypothetical protein
MRLYGVLTAGDDYKETKCENGTNADLVFQLHLETRNHGDGKGNDNDIGEDVDWKPVSTRRAGMMISQSTYRKS